MRMMTSDFFGEVSKASILMIFKLDSGCPRASSSFVRKYNYGAFNMCPFKNTSVSEASDHDRKDA